MADLSFSSNVTDSDDDNDYIPPDDEEAIINQELNTLSDSDTIKNVTQNLSPESSFVAKTRTDKLWKMFLEDEVISNKNINTDSNAILNCAKPVNLEPAQSSAVDVSHCELKISIRKQSVETTGKNKSISESSSCITEENKLHKSQADISSKKRSMGLNSLLGKIQNKKTKVTTLQKSLSDWESFKKDEDIGADLQIYNKGKSGYLERQAFLMRSDLRSFEVEKSVRLSKK